MGEEEIVYRSSVLGSNEKYEKAWKSRLSVSQQTKKLLRRMDIGYGKCMRMSTRASWNYPMACCCAAIPIDACSSSSELYTRGFASQQLRSMLHSCIRIYHVIVVVCSVQHVRRAVNTRVKASMSERQKERPRKSVQSNSEIPWRMEAWTQMHNELERRTLRGLW